MRTMILAAVALLSAAHANDGRLTPTLDLKAVRVEVTWVADRPEMNRLRRQYGQPPLDDAVIRSRLTGFSVLGKREGEYVCLIFAPRPEREDDRATVALGHELAHCLLGDYHP